MKRLPISIGIMSCLICFGIWSLRDFYIVKTTMENDISLLSHYISVGMPKEATLVSNRLTHYWLSEELHLLSYLRHSDMDSITSILIELPYLIADPDSTYETIGKVELLTYKLNHIWRSELPYIQNIL